MNTIKKTFGIVWLALAIAVGYFLISFGGEKLVSGKQDDLVFAIVILFILLPIIVSGLIVFGYYALVGEYNNEGETGQLS